MQRALKRNQGEESQGLQRRRLSIRMNLSSRNQTPSGKKRSLIPSLLFSSFSPHCLPLHTEACRVFWGFSFFFIILSLQRAPAEMMSRGRKSPGTPLQGLQLERERRGWGERGMGVWPGFLLSEPKAADLPGPPAPPQLQVRASAAGGPAALVPEETLHTLHEPQLKRYKAMFFFCSPLGVKQRRMTFETRLKKKKKRICLSQSPFTVLHFVLLGTNSVRFARPYQVPPSCGCTC